MAANVTTVIGRSARVRGRVSGDSDLEVQGFVEGDIAVSGDVTVEAEGIVGANVRGRRLVVRGAIKGDLVGEQAVVLEDGARVVGDIRAPRVTIAQGALVRGYIQTADDDAVAPPSARAQPAARPGVVQSAARLPAPSVRVVPAAVRDSSIAPPRAATKPDFAASQSAGPGQAGANAPSSPAKRQPPPPVVPVLKKLKGQILKKRER
jgi:cytoskeletal protein CcmA (bactofilin family)